MGSRYTEVALKVRKTPDADADVVTVLDAADKVKITDVTEDGYRQIVYKDKPRWVKAEFLSKSKPEASASGGLSTAPCASGSGVEGGIGANAIAAHRAICARFPQVTSYGGYRGGSANHSSGRALDVMVSGAAGWEIANWARANASALGITEVIHAQKIWTTQRAGDGWRGMSDPARPRPTTTTTSTCRSAESGAPFPLPHPLPSCRSASCIPEADRRGGST